VTTHQGQQRSRALARAGRWGVAARLISTAAALATTAILARSLGREEFGFLATVMTLIGILGASDLGLGSAMTTEIAQSRGVADTTREDVVVRVGTRALSVLGATVLLVGVALAVLTGAYRFVGGATLPPDSARAALAIVMIAVALGIPAAAGARVQMGMQRGDLVARWALLTALASLGGVAVAGAAHAPLPVLAAAATLTPVVVLLAQTVTVVPRGWWTSTATSGQVLRSLAGTGGLFLTLNLANVLSYQTDALVVVNVIGPGAAAVLAIHTRLFGAVSGLTSSALAQVWPALAEALAAGDLAWVRRTFPRLLLALGAASGAASVALLLLATPLVRLWVGGAYEGPVVLIAALAVWTTYGAVMGQCSQLLNAARVVRPQVAMATVMTAANIPASIWLAYKIGVAGPVVATIVCHVLVAGIPTTVLVRRVLSGSLPS
jgi:O-antigen/teichoic acid export membrane protein